MIDASALKKEFPILQTQVREAPLVYLDNAATTQKPQTVIDAIANYYHASNANVHRGVHYLSEQATEAFEQARRAVAHFINAPSERECIFTRGTTEAINLVANSFVLPRLNAGDEVLITHLEHHSNIVPWQLVCERAGANLVVAPINHQGEVIFDAFKALVNERTRFISVSHISNALGSVNPVMDMVNVAKQAQVPIMIDGAQAIAHEQVDVQALGCDFYAFSAHKMYGPTGIGVLWGKAQWLEAMVPYQGGGDMISHVTFERSAYAPIPYKFEAGTPNISAAVGLHAAITYLERLGLENIKTHEQALLAYATKAIGGLPHYRIIGTAVSKASVISLVHDSIHPHDMGTILDSYGIAVRSGHHCAMPVMDFFDVPATTRASLAVYNTREDIDALVSGLQQVEKVFA